MARLLREAIEGFAAPQLTDDLVHDALSDASLPQLPEGGVELRLFVESYLMPVLNASLGDDVGEAVRERLAPAVAALEKIAEAASTETLRETVRPSAKPLARPVIAIVGKDRRLAAELRLFIARHAEVIAYRALHELSAVSERPSVVLLDLRKRRALEEHPPSTALAGVPVVVWGDDENAARRVLATFSGASVSRCDEECELRGVSDVVLARLGVDDP